MQCASYGAVSLVSSMGFTANYAEKGCFNVVFAKSMEMGRVGFQIAIPAVITWIRGDDYPKFMSAEMGTDLF